MEIINNMSEFVMSLPQYVSGEIVGAARTMFMTKLIREDLAAGKTYEEVLRDRLIATANSNPEELHNAAEKIVKAVDDYYHAKDKELTADDLKRHMNDRMNNMTDIQRAKFLLNLLAMAPQEVLTEDELKQVIVLRDAEEISSEDVDFLVQLTLKALSDSAGVLSRTAVKAMDKSLPLLREDAVQQLVDADSEMAKAYALACYIEVQRGHKPWGKDSDKLAGTPYEIGLAAANGVETSKLMALYAKGKVTLEVAKLKLAALYQAAINLLSMSVMDVLAFAMELGVIGVVGYGAAAFLLNIVGMSTLYAVVGGFYVGLYTATCLLSKEDYQNVIESIWVTVQNLWSGVKSLWFKFFATKEQQNAPVAEVPADSAASAEAAEDEDNEENSEAEEDEDNEEDTEAEEDADA